MFLENVYRCIYIYTFNIPYMDAMGLDPKPREKTEPMSHFYLEVYHQKHALRLENGMELILPKWEVSQN